MFQMSFSKLSRTGVANLKHGCQVMQAACVWHAADLGEDR